MSLSFINFHMRDYQRDTQQLPLEGHGAYFLLLQHCWTHGRIPLDDAARAAICKVSLQRWRRQLAPLVNGYFDADGQNKRATIEVDKAEKMRLRQAMAGHKGGVELAKRKMIRKHSIIQPGATSLTEQEVRDFAAKALKNQDTGQAVAKPRSSHGQAMVEPSKREDITTTFSGAARAREPTEESEPVKEKSGSAVQQPASKPAIPVTSELLETVQKKRWV
jgi:uncharacterized protein YdaU (DUF1376 family)